MRQIKVKLKNNSYPIVIADRFDYFAQCINGSHHKCIILMDRNIERLYFQEFRCICARYYQKVLCYCVEPGEKSKDLQNARQIYQFLIKNSVCTEDVMICLGGGVIGDLGGFVAATYLRGIPLLQVPTSLLAQADSSVGGKNAVNINRIKNIVGAFYQPSAVFVNYCVLETLPSEEIRNGLVEILVHAVIKDASLFEFMEKNLEQILQPDLRLFEELIYRNCVIKSEVVQKDEKESGERAILNFGHTFGHAIESFYYPAYRHGECVALGIIGACYIAERLKFIAADVTERIKSLLKRMNVLQRLHDCDKEKILNYLMHDKKAINKKIVFILPLKIGLVRKYQITDMSYITEALERLIVDFSEERLL